MRRIVPLLATLAVPLVPTLALSAPPEATAYQITVSHAGATTSGGVLALQETPLWTVDLPDVASFPIIAGGKVFVTTRGLPSSGGGPGYGSRLHAFDAQTGANAWGPIDLSGTYYWTGIAYDAGKLFVVNFDGLLRSYDAATGTPGWSVQMPGYWFDAVPTASNGLLYISGNNGLHAVDESSGDIVWSVGVPGFQSSPAIGPNGLYVGYACPHNYALNLTSSTATGEFQWHQGNNGCSGGGGKTTVYANGRVYTRDGSTMTVLNAADGSVLTTFPSGTAPAVTSTAAFFMSNGTLTARDLATDTVQWTFAGDGGLISAPLVVDQTVIAGSSSGNLYGLNTQTGHVTWQVNTGVGLQGPDEHNVSQPLTGLGIANGLLVVPASYKLIAYRILGPAAPTGAAVTGGAGSVDLSWTAPAGAATYNVYMGTAAGRQNVVPVKTGVTGTTTKVTHLTPGTTYYFTIKAVGPNGISAPSNEVSATPHNPAPPTSLGATGQVGSISLTWTASSEALSYNVYLGTAPGAESSTPVATGVTIGAYSVTGLTPGVTYYFTVKSIAYGATSVASNEAFAVPNAAPPPSAVNATGLIGAVTLSWSAVNGATSYNVYLGTSAGGESSTPAANVTGNNVTINGLTANTKYYFVIKSVVVGVPGSASIEASATVLPTPAPAGLSATAAPGQAVLNWASSQTATSYSVYSCSGGSALLVLSLTTAVISGLTPDVQYCFVVKASGPAGLSAASNGVNVTPTRYAAPANVVATPAIGQITLTWNASPAATQYNVYMGTAAGLEAITPVRTVSGTNVTVSGLSNDTIYYFYVTATTPIGASLPSSEVSAAPLTPPPPTNVSITPAPGQVGLAWSASAGATSYNIYMGTAAAAQSPTPVQTAITGLGTIVTGLDPTKTYYFIVRAVTPNGLSSISNEVSAVPSPLPPAPTAPATVAATPGSNEVTISWSATAGATSYDVYVGTTSGNYDPTPVKTAVVGVTATITGLTNGTTYYFVVKAANLGGSSPPTSEVSAKPVAPPPPAPANLSAAAASGQITLSWAASPSATSYDVYVSTSSGAQSATATQTGVKGTSTTVTGLTNGTTYYYVVKAVNADGSSVASNEASATPAAPAQQTPSGGGGGGAFDWLSLALLAIGAVTIIRKRWAMVALGR
jgi:fibronectin type 3 domain-containing protein